MMDNGIKYSTVVGNGCNSRILVWHGVVVWWMVVAEIVVVVVAAVIMLHMLNGSNSSGGIVMVGRCSMDLGDGY